MLFYISVPTLDTYGTYSNSKHRERVVLFDVMVCVYLHIPSIRGFGMSVSKMICFFSCHVYPYTIAAFRLLTYRFSPAAGSLPRERLAGCLYVLYCSL